MRRGIAALIVGTVLGIAGSAQAATYEVNKRGDHAPGSCTPSDCTLREAVLVANASIGTADRVVLSSRRPYRIELGGADDGGLLGDFDVTNDRLTILHRGRGRATVDARGIARVFDAFSTLTLKKLKVTGGEGDYGGGVRTGAGLTAIKTVVSGNLAAECGGGIHTQDEAPLVLKRSRVSGNRAGSDGGGISASCFGSAGPVRIQRSKVVGNRSDADADVVGRGGGIYLQTADGVQSVVGRSTFANNRTGPGDSMFEANEGGAIYTDLGRLRITASTIHRNFAGDDGGGIAVDGTEPLVVVNSTIYGNRANETGGGIQNGSGEVSLNATTVVRNRGNADGVLSEAGSGLWLEENESFSVENSLIALNTLTALSPGDPPVKNDCSGGDPFDSLGHNLLSTRFLCDGFDGPGDRARAKVKIGKLKRNGGPTKTVALKQGSPAIGKAKRSTAPNRDQRGRNRGRDPDIGAFERLR